MSTFYHSCRPIQPIFRNFFLDSCHQYLNISTEVLDTKIHTESFTDSRKYKTFSVITNCPIVVYIRTQPFIFDHSSGKRKFLKVCSTPILGSQIKMLQTYTYRTNSSYGSKYQVSGSPISLHHMDNQEKSIKFRIMKTFETFDRKKRKYLKKMLYLHTAFDPIPMIQLSGLILVLTSYRVCIKFYK